tara:strand:+ start:2048 stop:2314 length:267 start_codon:yes stop_codon:yes gene_type:complete
MKPTIIFTQGPEGLCPVQAEGTVNGHPFYFRARHLSWSLSVASSPNGHVMEDDTWSHWETYPGVSAGAASTQECMEFINRAAELWANR